MDDEGMTEAEREARDERLEDRDPYPDDPGADDDVATEAEHEAEHADDPAELNDPPEEHDHPETTPDEGG